MSSLDRRVAVCAVVVGALVFALAIGGSDGPAPARPEADRLVLARQLAALANRGARSSWIVTFAFTRTNPAGSRLHETLVTAHLPSIEVDEGLGSLEVTAGGRTYACTEVGNQPQCLSSRAVGATSEPGAVYGGAVVSGRYDISRGPSSPIAGLEARCFFLRLRSGVPLSGLGFASEQCYSTGGVPLRSQIERPGGTDRRAALTVRRAVGRADLLPLVAPYGLAGLLPAE